MLGTFIIGMLAICSLILLAAWASDTIQAALEPAPVAPYSAGPEIGRVRVQLKGQASAITIRMGHLIRGDLRHRVGDHLCRTCRRVGPHAR
jgi:hypothetical protein